MDDTTRAEILSLVREALGKPKRGRPRKSSRSQLGKLASRPASMPRQAPSGAYQCPDKGCQVEEVVVTAIVSRLKPGRHWESEPVGVLATCVGCGQAYVVTATKGVQMIGYGQRHPVNNLDSQRQNMGEMLDAFSADIRRPPGT